MRALFPNIRAMANAVTRGSGSNGRNLRAAAIVQEKMAGRRQDGSAHVVSRTAAR